MALTPGQRLGAYEVLGSLGKGGMGEVYRARDTKLQREVAIKVLPESLATDRDRLARFEREAQLLAALNHPHIAAIYGVDTLGDTQFLVLELVEGDTLADRISRGALSLSEALALARQIAEALQAAHDKGIIHRDLKPANIALTADGQVKVLDFGLAKAMENAPASSSSIPSATLSPTLSLAMTEAGFILGTAAYMSPEQAKGRPADKRSDVWAFGCVLFEMLTAKRAFEGEDASDTLAGILRGDPDWKALPRGTPAHVREILTGCLAKDRKQRLADIAVVNYLLSEPRQAKGSSGRGVSRRAVFAFAAVALVIMAAVAGGLAWALRGGEPPAVVRFTIVPPAEQLIASTNSDRQLALSADGSKIVYVNASGQLVVRHLGQEELQVLQVAGTAARSPFWSPDGRWIGYTQNGSNELRKVSVTGGPSVLVTRNSSPPRGASWGPDDSIVFATADPTMGLMRVQAGGGEPEVLTKPDAAAKEQDHMLPSFLPGGRAVVFAISAAGSVENSQVAVLDLMTGKYRSLIRGGTHPQYVGTGHLVYSVAGSLRAVGFDLDTLTVTSDAVPVVEQVGMTSTGATQYAVSETGTLVYMPGSANGAGAARSLVWVDRKGLETPVAGAPVRSYTYPRLSHDNSRLAVSTDDLESDIVVFDFALRTPTRATFGPALDSMAVWYPGDERFLFVSARDGNPNLYAQRADGIGGVERLTYSKNNQFLPTMSPDGKLVVALEQRPGTGNDLVLLRLNDSTAGSQAGTPAGSGSSTGQRGLKSEPIVDTQASEVHPEISPDGRWLAYTTGESGKNEVFVQTFPDVSKGARWQVSADGGSRPAWSPAGGELFYVTESGAMMSVPLEPGPAFKWRNAVKLFDWPSIGTPGPARTYDVSRDGRRFLMVKEARGTERQGATATIRVVLNWMEELKQKLPAK